MTARVLFIMFLMSFSLFATRIGDFADSIPVGKWVTFPTPTLTEAMSTSLPSGTCYAYAQQAVWDSISKKLYFTGAAHGSSNNRAVEYSAQTNTWRNALCPREPGTSENRTGHTYDHLTIVPDSGIIYFATYNTSTYKKAYFFRYSFATSTWDTTLAPLCPGATDSNPRGNYVYAGAMEYFPDIKSLVMFSHDYGNYNGAILNLAKPRDSLRWSVLGGSAARLGYFHTIADYNPVSKTMLFLSDDGCQIMNATKQFRAIKQPAFSHNSYDAKVACDPVTGTHIAIDLNAAQAPMAYAYDSDNDLWQSLTGQGETQMDRDGLIQCEAVVFKMDEYGIVGLLSGSEPRVLLYKYAQRKDTLLATALTITATSTTLEEFMTSQMSVIAHYSGGSTDTITNSCFYRSLDSNVVRVTGCGKVSSLLEGIGRIEVTKRNRGGVIRDTLSFTVQQSTAVVDSLRISNRSFLMGERDSIALTATAYFTRATEHFAVRVDTNALFTSGNSAVALLRGGRVVGISQGTTYLIATYRGARDSVRVTVNPRPLSQGRTVNSLSTVENADWGKTRLVDGITTGVAGSLGFTSASHSSATATEWVEIDFGSDTAFTQVILFPRNDQPGTGITGAANFPVNYTIEVRTSAGVVSEVYAIIGQNNPEFTPVTINLTRTTGRYVRLTATLLGTPPRDETTNYRLQFAEMQVFDNGGVSTESATDIIEINSVSVAPNPLNPKTMVSYRLKPNVSGLYTIHDISGKLVWVKNIEKKAKGQKASFVWEAKDLSNRKLSTGVYMGQLTTSQGEKLSNRLLLLK